MSGERGNRYLEARDNALLARCLREIASAMLKEASLRMNTDAYYTLNGVVKYLTERAAVLEAEGQVEDEPPAPHRWREEDAPRESGVTLTREEARDLEELLSAIDFQDFREWRDKLHAHLGDEK